MENRLKRLGEEEDRAVRNQKLAEQKAQKMLKARGRHYQEMMDKIKNYQDKKTM
jgi:hypothetical protein